MTRGGGDTTKRVKTARGRTASSNRWLSRQLNDPYVRQAKAEGYRSRAAYKLIELDEKFGVLKGVHRVIDLGIAPGGWSQVVRKLRPKASVVGIDLLETDPIEGVTLLQMDFMSDDAPAKLAEALNVTSLRVDKVSHIVPAIKEAVAVTEAGKPFLLEFMVKEGYDFT